MLSQAFITVLWQGVVFGIFAAIFSIFITPLQVIKVIKQQTNNSYYSIAQALLKSSWKDFFRGVKFYSIMNFYSNFSFGVGSYIADKFITAETLISYRIFLRLILGGSLETLFTVYSEVKQITESKGTSIKVKVKILPLLLPLLCRNSLAWVGPACAYEFANLYHLSSFTALLLSFSLGLLSAAISVPFDVLTTLLCGAELNNRWKIIKTLKEERLFSGLVIRLIQTALFAIVTFLTMLIFYPLSISLER